MEFKPTVVITMGDPVGIGPEIIAKVIADGALQNLCALVVIGDASVMGKVVGDLGLSLAIRPITALSHTVGTPGVLNILDLQQVDISRHAWGKPDASTGKAAVAYIRKAVALAQQGDAAAMVTAPISKEMMNAAGYHYAGHTELLAELTGAREYGMFFVGGGLHVMLATIHIALKDVPKQITTTVVYKTIRLAHAAMRSLGVDNPRIGVAALNPHAGEGGMFGTEDREAILPAVIRAREEGIYASDPLPADTLFYQARNKLFDIVVAMYHDQGLAPLKMLAFGKAVNVTVGLPIIRTSVDHGTAFAIAGRGCADPSSLMEAVKLAVVIAAHRTGKGEQAG